MLDDPIILTCLAEYITVGTLFRLRRALGRNRLSGCLGVKHMCCKRIGFSRPFDRMSDLCYHMNHKTHRRCRECCLVTSRSIRVCTNCTSITGGYYELVSRRDINSIWTNVPPVRVRHVYKHMIAVVCRRRSGEFLYWRYDVSIALGSPTGKAMRCLRACDTHQDKTSQYKV